jgi:hypothetical protein
MKEEMLKDLLACRSAQEFKLKAEIAHGGAFTADDFVEMVSNIEDYPDFISVLNDAIRDTELFDGAFGEKDYYIDYYLAKMENRELEHPDDFVHLRVLDAFMHMKAAPEWWSWTTLPKKTRSGFDEDVVRLYKSTVEKLRRMHGDLATISNFSRIRLGIR